ncbi:hypothetical protein CK203_005787 [Vitis vinifera]|uniref:RNase H type-1 domain-containing protein n=1 Tax=Vitis vinifera TaxID=29760 RepID=A0A438K499_VITVI|nr:hypothetical protein CK203_005787 [Vitis vinifera]
MYLAVSEWAISDVLFRCPSTKEQKPIYYVSRALADVETRNQAKRNDGLCESMEPPIVRIRGRAPAAIPNRRTSGASHPTGVPASNNEVEYEVILSGLDLALALSVSKLRVYSDSQLVVRHVQKEYEAKDARMARYLTK